MSELIRLIDALKKGNPLSESAIIKLFEELWRENSGLKSKIGQQEKYAELGKRSLARHLEDRQNTLNKEKGINEYNITAYIAYLDAMNKLMEELLAAVQKCSK